MLSVQFLCVVIAYLLSYYYYLMCKTNSKRNASNNTKSCSGKLDVLKI